MGIVRRRTEASRAPVKGARDHTADYVHMKHTDGG